MELPPPSPQDARPPARPRSLSDSSEHLLHFERVKRVKLEAAQLVSESCRLSSSSWKSDMCTARSVRQRIAHNRRRVSPIGLGSTATAPLRRTARAQKKADNFPARRYAVKA